jgi:hypothetical protein
MTARALPEKYRLARNVREGYEIRTNCPIHQTEHWLPVTDVLEVLAPIAFVSFTVGDTGLDCLGDTFTVRPNRAVYSRRVAS